MSDVDDGYEALPGEAPTRRTGRGTTIAVIVAALVLVVAAIATVPHFIGGGGGGGGGAKSQAPQLATAALESFPVTVNATGTVVPKSEIPVNFSSPGRVSAINVAVGQAVQAGTVLASLDSTVAQGDIARAQSAVTTANAQLAAAQNPLDPARAAQLQGAITSAQTAYNQTVNSVQATASQDASTVAVDRQQLTSDQARLASDDCSAGPTNIIICQTDQSAINTDQGRIQEDGAKSQSDATQGQVRESQAQQQIIQAQAALTAASAPSPVQIATAESAVSNANAQLTTARAELANLSVVAPSAGTVLQINGQVGETVTGAATSSATLPGTNAPIPAAAATSGTAAGASPAALGFIVVGDVSSYVVGVPFPASDVHVLAAKQGALITAATLGGLAVPGRVLAIASATTVVDGAPVVYATVVPTGPATQLSSGLVVNVTVNITEASSVLAVPQSAVYLVGGIPHVDVWNGQRPVSTAISTGEQGTQLVQVTAGLSAGQQVVLTAYGGLPQTATTTGGQP